jgi:molybdate/tungstate transport system substrate-binding protein
MLPPEINLADPAFSNFYKIASYTLENGNGQTVFGEPIYFSFTILVTIKNLDGVIAFANFILSAGGRNIIKEHGLSTIRPEIVGDKELVPEAIIRPIFGLVTAY